MRALLLIALLFVSGCGTAPQPAATPHLSGQVITITDTPDNLNATDTVRIGKLRSGEIAQLSLQLANATDQPLVLLSHRTTCGCARLQYANQPLLPGDTLPMQLTFDSRGTQGWQFKSLDLILSSREHPRRLYIEADIE